MPLYSIPGLAVALFILAATPGPGVFATTSRALAVGFRQTVPMIVGMILGDLFFLLLAIYGLAAMAENCAALFMCIRFLGGCYLIWLGIRTFLARPTCPDTLPSRQHQGRHSVLAGLALTLGNPKVILFYLGFLPTFLDLDSLTLPDILTVSAIVALVLGTVMAGYACMASRARALFADTSARKFLNRTGGGVMIGIGTLLLAKS